MTARQLRIFELVLVLSIAFLPAIIQSITFVATGSIGYSELRGSSVYVIWIAEALVSIALLYYVLLRNNKSFVQIGFKFHFAWHDVLSGVALVIAGYILMNAIYLVLYSISPTIFQKGYMPQNTGFLQKQSIALIIIISVVFPLQEELIVRGFTMTEVFALSESKTLAVAISVIIQFSYHLYQGLPAALMLLPYFVLVAIYFVRTGNLNAVVLSHMLTDLVSLLRLR